MEQNQAENYYKDKALKADINYKNKALNEEITHNRNTEGLSMLSELSKSSG